MRMGLSRRWLATSGWPMKLSSAQVPLFQRPSIAARVTGWWRATILPCRSPVGKATSTLARSPTHTPVRRKIRAWLAVAAAQGVEGADRGHHERGRDHGGDHVVRVLDQRPRD